MHIQTCVKGITGETTPGASDGITWAHAVDLVAGNWGIQSRWWLSKGNITPVDIASVLTRANLERHLHDYAVYGPQTPFISLAAGFVQRDHRNGINRVYSAIDTALQFATKRWRRPGALFYCWTPVATEAAVEVMSVSEAVRDTLVYRRWSRYQHQGEITAKVYVPANQISRVEWWDGANSKTVATHTFGNPNFIEPTPLLNYRELF